MKKSKFEASLKRLEEIVSTLEDGNLSIEESLKLFEEGVGLSRLSNKILDDAERRVESLVKGDDSLTREPFAADDSTVDSNQAEAK
ncbi:MAG: exodeoxyribonuclease VII small subunit [Thermodesulfobacteriota bacterium]